MAHGAEHTERRGIPDQNVEMSPTFGDGRPEIVDRAEIRQIDGHQGRGAARCPDTIVDFLQAA